MMNLNEIINLMANLAQIADFLLFALLTLIGYFFFWPRFIKQKRMENANENSWQTLKYLDIAEEKAISLFWASKMRKTNDEQYYIQKNVITAIRNLRTGLLVLKETSPKIKNHLDEFERIILAQTIRIATIKNEQLSPYLASIDLLVDLNMLEDLNKGPYNHENPNLTKFEELRTLLASIAGLYHRF